MGPLASGWVVAQAVLLGGWAVILALAPRDLPPWLVLPGLVLMLAGGLAGSLATWEYLRRNGGLFAVAPAPTTDHALVTSGIYRWIRHPVYSAVLGLALGASLVLGSLPAAAATAILLLFFWAKSRHEDQRLAATYRNWDAWASRTGRFLPGIGTARSRR